MLKGYRIQTTMKATQPIRFALAIAAALLCGGLARAQDANSLWLLHAPRVSTRRVLDLSAARIGPMQAQSRPDSQTPNPTDSVSRKPSTQAPDRIIYDEPAEHRFWDTTNDLLFAGVGASRTLDYFSTLNMRRRGRDEILLTNDVVDNHAAFAVIEAAGTGASIGVSYLFHHYGHHKLERATSIVHIGLATSGAVRNYCLKTAHPATASPVSAAFMVAPGIAPLGGPH
ncbi:MAG TPA: hypothetical protein VGJ06_06400 [Candidatus Acidoferrum sp.]|jgi:hypothetical protein